MTSLVTGGAGFIGGHLVRELIARGDAVRVLDIDPGEELPPEAEVVRGSVTDPASVKAATKGVARVFHLAANANLWARRGDEFEAVNHQGTRHVLEAARESGAERVVVTSSEVVFVGRSTSRRPMSVDETTHLSRGEMLGPYCRSKHAAEAAALSAAREGLPVVVVNPTLPIGPGDRRPTPPSRMLLGLLNGRTPAVIACVLNFIDVRDAAIGHVLAAERGRPGERYILNAESLDMRAFVALVGEITGAPMPRRTVPYPVAFAAAAIDEFMSDHITHRQPTAPLTGVRLAHHPVRFSAEKAVRELGLPTRPLRDSLTDAITWLAGRGLVERPLPNLDKSEFEPGGS